MVECVDGGQRLGPVRHLHESESARLARDSVDDHVRLEHFAMLLEQPGEQLIVM